MVNFFHGCLVPMEMSPNYHLSRRLGGLHNWLDTLEEREISYPCYLIICNFSFRVLNPLITWGGEREKKN
jgi:hypothetical protein